MPAIAMPRLSDSMEEGTIVSWLVADGATVAVGEALAEIETDKAVMVYEAESAGTLQIVAAAGDTVAVGAPIGQLLGAGESLPEDPAPVPVREPIASASRPRATPVARRIAADRGVDLAGLTGTGPGGRIVKRDVIGAGAGTATVLASPAGPVEGGAVESARGGVTVEDLNRVQQTVARRMAEAKANQPEFTLSLDVDMGAALELRAQLKQAAADAGRAAPTVNDLVIKAAALALRDHPRANGAYRDGRFELYDRVNVGVAVAASDALLVPVVSDADRLSLGEIAARTSELGAKAREGSLTAPDLSGATFTVSNLGMFGIERFTAILNSPQAAILAVGAVRETAVAAGGEISAGRRMAATLTCDHRILYGADAARFLSDLRSLLEEPFGLVL